MCGGLPGAEGFFDLRMLRLAVNLTAAAACCRLVKLALLMAFRIFFVFNTTLPRIFIFICTLYTAGPEAAISFRIAATRRSVSVVSTFPARPLLFLSP